MDEYEFNLISEDSKTEDDEFYNKSINDGPKEIEQAYITDLEKNMQIFERENILAKKQEELEEMLETPEISKEEQEFNLASEDGGKTIH